MKEQSMQPGKKWMPLLLLALLLAGCGNKSAPEASTGSTDSLQGQLILFHAGSLAVPIRQICDSFTRLHPSVTILPEAAGSKSCARKIADLGKACDVFASADYKVIENLLFPEHATWHIPFATNEMSIVYTLRSHHSDKINAGNWTDILQKKDVLIGRSDPESDPCGVRAILCMMLAEQYYQKPGLTETLSGKDKNFIRPKETDLIALLETRSVDYIFLYRSVATQHGLKYLILPDSVNLGNSGLAAHYATVSMQVRGKTPSSSITETGEPMIYAITIPRNAPNPRLAESFAAFFLSSGMPLLESSGQRSIVPAYSPHYQHIPSSLLPYVKKEK